jgi:hypothetical protein
MLTYAGGVDKERAFVVSTFVSEWKSGGWNLQVLSLLLFYYNSTNTDMRNCAPGSGGEVVGG